MLVVELFAVRYLVMVNIIIMCLASSTLALYLNQLQSLTLLPESSWSGCQRNIRNIGSMERDERTHHPKDGVGARFYIYNEFSEIVRQFDK